MTRKRCVAILAICSLLTAACVALAGLAGAATIRVGTLVLHADGGFEPQLLPKRTYAPIHFQAYGEIKTTDGSMPPALQHVKLDFDRDGRLAFAGLPTCPPERLEGASTQGARNGCRGAIVGRGEIEAAVPLAGARVRTVAPLTLFNGPRREGNPTVVFHAQAPAPVSETYVVVIPIERRQGIYGYRTEFDVPPIAGGTGSLTRIEVKVGRTWVVGGSKRSYVSARCSDYILQTRGFLSFADGNVIYGAIFKTCRPKE